MKAVLYEYGIINSLKVFENHFLFEYSRLSQHPQKSGYAETGIDVIKAGIVFPEFYYKQCNLLFWFRTSYTNLFNFWNNTGLVYGKKSTRFLLYFEYFHSNDTRENGNNKANLFGLGFKVSLQPNNKN